MKNRLKGKTALITGATSGIGKTCAEFLAKEGVKLILTGRKIKKLQKLQDTLKTDVQIMQLDVRDKKSVKEELKKIKKIDILINNAGLALGLEPLDKGSIQEWEEMIDTNIKGLLYISKEVIPKMRKHNRGHIINLGSIAGRNTYPNGNVYCATKSAVHTLNEAMNIDLADTNIKVSNVAPGAVETNFSNTRFNGDKEKANDVYKGYKPLSAEDIADLIVYILNTPEHVNIQDTLIMPTAQRNPYILSKNS